MRPRSLLTTTFIALSLVISISSGCSAKASDVPVKPESVGGGTTGGVTGTTTAAAPAAKGATITISPDSPADTVRVFYKNLRENRIREAIFLTNLRPAIEGLTDTELKEFQVDFEEIGRQIPAEIEINGEIVSGDSAVVTAKLPGSDPDQTEVQQIQLRRENGIWVILTVDAAAEKLIRQEGKNYFYALKIETHEQEAREMLDRIAKAQMAHSVQHGGNYADIATLVEAGLLAADSRSSESTGYNYFVKLSADKKEYSAGATPGVYGKTGKLSFSVKRDKAGALKLTSKDNGGKPLSK